MLHAISKFGWLVITPSNLALFLLLGGCVLLVLRRTRHGIALIGTATAFLAMCTLMPVGHWLLEPLESRFEARLPGRVDGVIVLGGASEPAITAARGTVALNGAGERLIALADLARRYPDARLVFSGGFAQIPRAAISEADVVRQLAGGLGLNVNRIVFEDRSRNTFENALFSKRLAKPTPEETWLLVTSAFHMPRARAVFDAVDWKVLAHPVDFRTTADRPPWIDSSISMAGRLEAVDTAVREHVAFVVYYVLGRIDYPWPFKS